MKNKSLFLLIIAFLWIPCAKSQDVESTKKIPSTYDRSSITLISMQFPNEAHASEVQGKVDKISFSDKYYNNNLDQLTFSASFSRSANLSESIKQYLNEQQIGRQIISKWFVRQADGTMSMDLIFDRGMFNATDAAYIKAQSTKLGNAVLQDYGNRLIGRSYVLVLDYQSVQNMKEAKVSDMNGWKSTVTGYLYKIQYSEEIQNAIYDSWIYPEDTPEVKAEKNKKFEQINIPVEFVTKTTIYATALQSSENSQLGKFIKQKSDDVLLAEMVQKGYDENLYSLEKNYEDFMVKTTIYQVHPLRAKIGKKEGLKCDNRYFVYEYVYNEKTNTTKPVRRGVIRATSKIVDNRQVATGDMGTSKFYQTAGRKLRTGYLLRQQNDFGAEFGLGYEMGEVGGAYGRLDVRLGRYIGIKSFFLLIEGGAQLKDYEAVAGTTDIDGILFAHYGAGLAKGFMITRNIELRPYISIGQEIASNDDLKAMNDSEGHTFEGLKVLYGKGGANLALNLRHNVQIFGGVGYYSFISKPKNTDDEEINLNWDEIFKDRGGISTLVGLRIGF